ncbi:MAG: beta galactosidase jelly roll domain-containing protein, partial [Clostridia bacterium]|nr:beta galactosidase jelly roll domain-containing protein [Clostridia bacterium]
VTNWENRSLPFRYPQVQAALTVDDTQGGGTEPRLFSGTFSARPGVDTFLQFADIAAGSGNMTRGQVWINGFAVGRYWNIGPQETLYIPGDLLKEENRIDILDLHSDGSLPYPRFCDTQKIDGLAENAEVVLA